MHGQDQLGKSVRKLRKQLKGFPADPRPEQVHLLRTQTRRIEATVAYLMLDSNRNVRRLFKVMKPMRKVAGLVRDLDVLIAEVLTLEDRHNSHITVDLVVHLVRKRIKGAKKLHKIIIKHRDEIRRRLKRSSRLIGEESKHFSKMPSVRESATQSITAEIARWPDLNPEKLHPFRIKVKELRNMLQLNSRCNREQIGMLDAAKDAIGEWHDWVELRNIAQKVLKDEESSALLKTIEATARQKLGPAIRSANSVRQSYSALGKVTH